MPTDPDKQVKPVKPTESIYEMEPFVLPGEEGQEEPKQKQPVATEKPAQKSVSDSKEVKKSLVSHLDDEQTISPGLNRPSKSQKTDFAEKKFDKTKMIEEFNRRSLVKRSQANLDPRIGTVINGKYAVFDIIGEGNMAIVYKGRQLSTGNIVACKTYRSDASDIEMARFKGEIRTHSKLKHENIVKFIDAEKTEDGQMFIIMEVIRGISLQEILEIHGPVERAENIWSILNQCCLALAHAHENGVIHRDLKTGNIILAKKENQKIVVKMVDFGISKGQDESAQRLTREGRTIGSPLYMSPEQCNGQELTPLSDVYSLGILAFEMIAGHPPYRSTQVIELMQAHTDPDYKPESLKEAQPNIPAVDQLEQIIFKAIATDPNDRIVSVEQFRKCLEFWIELVRKNELDKQIPENFISGGIPIPYHPKANIDENIERLKDLKMNASRRIEEAKSDPEIRVPKEAKSVSKELHNLIFLVIIATTIFVSIMGYLVYRIFDPI